MWEANRVSEEEADDDDAAKKRGDEVEEGAKGTPNPFNLVLDDLQVAKGTLTVVAGKVGSGKSSFLSALLGEMMLIENEGKMRRAP